jgi:hypothetical protein
MQYRETCFEIKRLGDNIWQKISEKAFLEKLADCVDGLPRPLQKCCWEVKSKLSREFIE